MFSKADRWREYLKETPYESLSEESFLPNFMESVEKITSHETRPLINIGYIPLKIKEVWNHEGTMRWCSLNSPILVRMGQDGFPENSQQTLYVMGLENEEWLPGKEITFFIRGIANPFILVKFSGHTDDIVLTTFDVTY